MPSSMRRFGQKRGGGRQFSRALCLTPQTVSACLSRRPRASSTSIAARRFGGALAWSRSYIARNRGRLPWCPDRTFPLLWQLIGTSQLRPHTHDYRSWRPPAARPYATWPRVGQIAATVGLHVLAQTEMAMWSLLADLGACCEITGVV